MELNVPHGAEAFMPTISFLVNGVPLTDLVRAAEMPYATAEGTPSLAGDYAPLGIHLFGDRRGLLGQPRTSWFDDGDTVLMGCPSCDSWGCWPLTAMIEVDDAHVTWRELRNGHRAWDLSALGPFVFDRAEYEDTVAVLG